MPTNFQSAAQAFQAELQTYQTNLDNASYTVSDAERAQALATAQAYYTFLENSGIQYGSAGVQVSNNIGVTVELR